MMLKRYAFTAAVLFFFSSLAFAATSEPETIEDKISAFRQQGEVALLPIKVPTVVEVPIDMLPLSTMQMAVFDVNDHVFVSNVTIQKDVDTFIQIASGKARGQASFLNDQDFATYVDFDLPEADAGEAALTFTSGKPLTADALWIGLPSHVAMPEKVEIRAEVEGVFKIVLAAREGKSVCLECLSFPETTASKWQVKLRYGQPLRIAEIALQQMKKQETTQRSLRFLAQPNHSYHIFYDSERAVSIPVGEFGDLHADQGVLRLKPTMFKANNSYREADLDKDNVPDSRDNCVSVVNFDQTDVDGNLRGDACDDYDRDHIINSLDNCPDLPNALQQDVDGDKLGDVCDKEESRITEKYNWLPWLALIGAAILILFFFFRVAKNTPPKDEM